jgi:hypothetical protein
VQRCGAAGVTRTQHCAAGAFAAIKETPLLLATADCHVRVSCHACCGCSTTHMLHHCLASMQMQLLFTAGCRVHAAAPGTPCTCVSTLGSSRHVHVGGQVRGTDCLAADTSLRFVLMPHHWCLPCTIWSCNVAGCRVHAAAPGTPCTCISTLGCSSHVGGLPVSCLQLQMLFFCCRVSRTCRHTKHTLHTR